MKAQVDIGFILSITIFLGVVIFISYTTLNNYQIFQSESEKDILRAKGFMISEILILDKGYPDNWNNLNSVQRLGLAEKPYVLNKDKVLAIDSCSFENYTRIKNLLGLSYKYALLINITKINFASGDEEVISSCGLSGVSLTLPLFWTKRFAVLENEVVKVDIVIY